MEWYRIAYTAHSLAGEIVSGTVDVLAESPDEAVYLPGRNALLIVKAAVWCQLHGIAELALAPLGTSPFDDASAAFLGDFQTAINRGCGEAAEISRIADRGSDRGAL